MFIRFFGPFLEDDNGGSGGGNPDPEPTPAGGGDTSGSDAKFTQADLETKISERLQREGIKELKRKAAEFDRIKASEQTEAEKVAARAKELEDRERTLTQREQRVALQDEIARVTGADKITLVAPVGDVLRLLDTDAVTWDDGKPVNVGPLVKQLIKERPYLAAKRSGSADGGEGSGEVKKNTMNDLIRGAWRGE